MLRLLGAAVVLAAAVSCRGISYPGAPTPSAPTFTPTTINLVPGPPELPVGGGTAIVRVEVLDGLRGVPAARVVLSASSGALSATDLVTDASGHGTVEWTGTATGTVTGRIGDVVGTTTVRVAVLIGQPPTPTPGPPGPPDPPTPPTTLTVAIAAPLAMYAGESAEFRAHLSGNGVPFTVTTIEWDFSADGQVDRIGSPTSWTYPSVGTQVVAVHVVADDGRRADAHLRIDVVRSDALGVTLTASPASASVEDKIILTAIPTIRVGSLPGGLQYAWDLTGDGTVDETTSASTYSISFTTAGTRTLSVTVIAPDGRRVTAATTVTVRP